MSTIIALESSCEACSVALWHEAKRWQKIEMTPREHSRKMLPMVDDLLAEANVDIADVDAFAFGAGPGSFTGLRIAVGIVQGLAYATDKPVIAVPSLLGMAHTAVRILNLNYSASLVIAIDARMGEVYWAEFTFDGSAVNEVSEVSVARYEDVLPKAEQFIALGSGWALPEMQYLLKSATHVDAEFLPQAFDLLALADERLQLNQFSTAAEAVPEYVRNTVSWKKIHEQ